MIPAPNSEAFGAGLVVLSVLAGWTWILGPGLGRWLHGLISWRTARTEGVWLYEENIVSGRRRAWTVMRGGYSPLDLDWLDAGRGLPEVNGRPAWRSAQGQADGRYCN